MNLIKFFRSSGGDYEDITNTINTYILKQAMTGYKILGIRDMQILVAKSSRIEALVTFEVEAVKDAVDTAPRAWYSEENTTGLGRKE